MRSIRPDVELEFITPYALHVIERAGRTCYKSEEKITANSATKFVQMVLKRGHESVIEHAYASFRVVADRGVSHEFVRHRLMSYSQESTRYCNYGKADSISVVPPPEFDWNDEAQGVWTEAVKAAETAYLKLIAMKFAPQIARSVLPICLKTEFVATANFREWRHFLRLRTAPAAHPLMREVAFMIGRLLCDEYSVLFDDVISKER